MKVSIVEYRPQWRKMFEEEKPLLQAVLGEVSAKVEHIGSTAVNGLAAKPVIDIMIGLPDFSVADNLVPKIETLGYEYIKSMRMKCLSAATSSRTWRGYGHTKFIWLKLTASFGQGISFSEII